VGEGGVELNQTRIEVGLGVRIHSRHVALPHITDGLTKLLDVLAIVAEMHRELLPTDGSGAFGIDPRQAVGQPRIQIERVAES